MVRSKSVGSLVTSELHAAVCAEFPELLTHPDFREDALQELALVELGETVDAEEKLTVARRELTWLSYELGLRCDRPAHPRVDYAWLKDAVSGTLLRDADGALAELRLAA
jgi:hypothetical protein